MDRESASSGVFRRDSPATKRVTPFFLRAVYVLNRAGLLRFACSYLSNMFSSFMGGVRLYEAARFDTSFSISVTTELFLSRSSRGRQAVPEDILARVQAEPRLVAPFPRGDYRFRYASRRKRRAESGLRAITLAFLKSGADPPLEFLPRTIFGTQ